MADMIMFVIVKKGGGAGVISNIPDRIGLRYDIYITRGKVSVSKQSQSYGKTSWSRHTICKQYKNTFISEKKCIIIIIFIKYVTYNSFLETAIMGTAA